MTLIARLGLACVVFWVFGATATALAQTAPPHDGVFANDDFYLSYFPGQPELQQTVIIDDHPQFRDWRINPLVDGRVIVEASRPAPFQTIGFGTVEDAYLLDNAMVPELIFDAPELYGGAFSFLQPLLDGGYSFDQYTSTDCRLVMMGMSAFYQCTDRFRHRMFDGGGTEIGFADPAVSLDGRFLWIRSGADWILRPYDGDATGSPFPVDAGVMRGLEGGGVAVFSAQAGGIYRRDYSREGQPLFAAAKVHDSGSATPENLTVNLRAAGRFSLSWVQNSTPWIQDFSADGSPLGAPRLASSGEFSGASLPSGRIVTTADLPGLPEGAQDVSVFRIGDDRIGTAYVVSDVLYVAAYGFAPLAADYVHTLDVLDNDYVTTTASPVITAINGEPPAAADSGNTASPSYSVTLPSGAIASVVNSAITYDATNAPFAGPLGANETFDESFSYTISDGMTQDTATVTIRVAGVNDAPSADDDALFVLEDDAASDMTNLLLTGDSDPDTGETAQLTITAANTSGTQGLVTVQNGALTYSPGPNFTYLAAGQIAADSFTYTVSDPHGATATATVSVTITGQNDVPIAPPIFGAMSETDRPANVAPTALSTARDPDADDSLALVGFDATGTTGRVTFENGALTYDPRGRFEGLEDGQTITDTFTYIVEDQSGAQATGSVQMRVSGTSGTLTARLDGLGSGLITSTPGGIQCGNSDDDCGENYDNGVNVTLTATPSANSNFEQWTTGPCSGQAGACVVPVGDADITATARFTLASPPDGRIVAATLPGARSGYLGGPEITAFMTVISRATTPAQGCRVTAPGTPPFALTYRQLDANSQPAGPENPVFDLVSGGSASFVLALTPQMATGPSGYVFQPQIACDNADLAPIEGVNSVLVTIGTGPVPDILSIGVTPSGDGVVRIPATGNRIGIATAAAVNIGAGDGHYPNPDLADVAVSVDTGAASLPVTLELCEIDPNTAACMSARSAGPLALIFQRNTSRFFGIFVRANESATVPFDPANARVFLRFAADGATRSVTSAAISAPAPATAPVESGALEGRWSILLRQSSGDWPSLRRADLYVDASGRAILDDGLSPRAITLAPEILAGDGSLQLGAGSTRGSISPVGTIRLGTPLEDDPGAFWGIRDDRGLSRVDFADIAGRFGPAVEMGPLGDIQGLIGDCRISGRQDGLVALFPVVLSGCAQAGHYLAVVDLPVDGIGEAVLIIAGENQGWRLERQQPN